MLNVSWCGYHFSVHTMDGAWNDVGGVYVFAGRNLGRWKTYYVGQTRSFANRLPSHERWAEAKRLGATHVHIRRVSNASRRRAIEIELIRNLNPPLNDD